MAKNSIPEYQTWKRMKARCYSPCNKYTGNYQKNGITVCDEWINDFDRFFSDVGKKPSIQHSLDRIDNLKGYSKDNCRWATVKEQCDNRGDFNDIITFNNETKTLKDWARHFNIKYTTLYHRIYRNGLLFEEAILNDPYNRLVEIKGENRTVKEWCVIYEIKYSSVINRIHYGWDKVMAILTPISEAKQIAANNLTTKE